MPTILTSQQLQHRLDSSPFNRWLGLRVSELTDENVTLHMVVRTEMAGNPDTGVLHGGLMGCLIDAAGALAIIARTGNSVATIDFSVDFLQAQRHPDIFAKATVLRLGNRISTTEIHVREGNDRLIASGRAVYMSVQAANSA